MTDTTITQKAEAVLSRYEVKDLTVSTRLKGTTWTHAIVKFPHGEGDIDIWEEEEEESTYITREAYPTSKEDYSGVIPEDAKIWKGRGYTGGHVSQSHWDTDQHRKEAFSLLALGYFVIDDTYWGHSGGYEPTLIYWKP